MKPLVDLSRNRFRLRILVLAVLGTVIAAVALSATGNHGAEFFVIALLAGLSVVGIFTIFASVTGLIHFSRQAPNNIAQTYADHAADGLLITDAQQNILYANRSYDLLTGAKGAAGLQTIEGVFRSKASASEALYRLLRAMREQRPASEDLRLDVGAEAGQWLRVSLEPLGQDLFAWVISDISDDRERHEAAYLKLQRGLDHFDHVPVGTFAFDSYGRVSDMNQTLAVMLHYQPQDLLSQLTIHDLLAGEGAALLMPSSGQAGSTVDDVLELDLKTNKGARKPCRLLRRVFYGAEGQPDVVRIVVLLQDPQADRTGGAHDFAEQRFARFFNNTPVAIATLDRNARIVRTNASFARLFREVVGGDAGVGRFFSTMIAEKDKEHFQANFESIVSHAVDAPPLDVALGNDGQRFARFYLSALDDKGDEGESLIVYAFETTEQKTLEAQFAQSQKMQAVGQLAGGIAHDFNNVLTAILGYSDLLLTQHRPTDPSFQDIMQIKQNATRAASLVRQLLAFSRKQTLRPQVLQLTDVLSDLTLMLKRLLGETVSLDVRHARDLWPLKADVNQLEQVIVNLAVNARDAMPSGGSLSIRTRNVEAHDAVHFDKAVPSQDFVLIEVQDSGTGIPKDILDKIFEPFFTTKEIGKGTGLGLSMVYGIVKQTGGFIFCDSQPGQGTTFKILLPRHVVEASAEPAPVEVAPVAQPVADLTGQGTILLVEDEEAVRAFGSRALRSRGYEVLEAASGLEALSLMADYDGHVDLVVSDVVMPEMDGPSMLRELRKTHPKLKIIFVSGYAEDAFRKNLGEEEDFGFLPKPFSLKDLIEKVKQTITARAA